MTNRIFTLFAIMSLISCGTARLTENDAVRLAENYVLEQGYTDKKIQIDSTIIEPDYVEQIMSRNGIIKMRYNTLKPKAAFNSKKIGKWRVGFEQVDDSTRFHIVHIYRNGKRIEMPHQDVKLTTENNKSE